MTKLLKKSLALVLTLALCLSAMACCFIVSAEGEEPTRTLTIELDETTANPVAGDTVILNVVGSWTDVAGAEFTVTGLEAYDLTLTPTNTEDDVLYEHADGTVKFVDGNNEPLDDGVLFSISFVAATAGNYTAAIADVVFCDVDENDVAVTYPNADAPFTFTVAEPVVEPEEPEVDANITIAPAINLTETINLRYILSNIPECDDFYIEFTHDRCDGSYNFIEGGYTYTVYKKDLTVAGSRYAYLYNQMRLYELGIEITAKVYCLDANDNVIYVSNPNTTTVADQAKASFASSSNAKAKTLYSDIIELGSVAQTYFVNGKDVDLADVTLPNEGFTGTPSGDIDVSTLNSVNAYTPVDGVAVTIAGSLTITGNPVIRFQVSGAGTYDAANLKLVTSYTSPKYGEITAEYPAAEMTTAGSGTSVRYFALFNSVALCDGNQGVTATLYDGTTELGSLDYSIEAAIAAASSSSRAYSLYMHTAKLGVSARAYWNL